VTVTDKDVDEYFAQHQGELPKRPESVRLSQLVLVPTASPVLEDAGREKALGLLARIKAGADFAKVAAEVSDDPGTKARGGDLGWFGRNEMDRTFENVAFSTPPGEIGGPVRTRYGYHVIKVEEAQGDRVHARHILVRVTPSTADVARTRKQMNDIRARITKGEAFAALASAYSMDPGSKDRGGDLGEVPLSQLTPTLRGVVDSLGVGSVSRVLSDDDVMYLFMLTGRTAEMPFTLAEIRDDLKDLVRQQRMQDLYTKWVRELRTKFFIDVKPRAQG
jgi:peptidyl-prolyl cis-trans isomerase SurA